MEWIDGNIGSKVTMKYPSVWMVGEHAKGEVLSVAMAGEGRHQDAGAKMVHAAPDTREQDHLEDDRPRRWPYLVPGLVRVGRLAPQPFDGEGRRAAGRRDLALGHLPVRRHRRATCDGARGDGLEDQRRRAST